MNIYKTKKMFFIHILIMSFTILLIRIYKNNVNLIWFIYLSFLYVLATIIFNDIFECKKK